MADQKISALTADAAPSVDDLLVSVNDPSGTPANRKVTVGDVMAMSPEQNLLINGNFDIWQSGTTYTTPNDDTYLCDMWNNLQEANGAWTFSQSTDAPAGSRYSLKAANVTLNNQCGVVYFMESADALNLVNKTVSVSLQAKTTTAKVIDNLRVAVLSWSSTADTITSDVIGTWAQGGTNPTWATNWTLENTPANLALSTSWTKFKSENFVIDTASMANVAVVIWVDDGTIAATDEFYLAQVQLNIGAVAIPFTPRPVGQELALCQRYLYVKSTAGSASTTVSMTGYAVQTTVVTARAPTLVPMRTTPTLIATGSDWQVADSANAGIDCTAIAIGTDPNSTPDNIFLQVTVSGATQFRPYQIRGDGGGTRTYTLDARL